MMMLVRTLTFLSAFLLLVAPAHAFIDSAGLSKSLKSIEQELSEEGIDSFLKELDEIVQEDPAAYLTVNIEGQQTTMWDIPKNAWFFSSVRALTELGIVSGYKDVQGMPTGEFGAGNNVTRAEALKIAIGAAGMNVEDCEGFLLNPSAKGHWAQQYVLCAQEKDFGLQSDQDINASASRAEVLHYVLRAFGVQAPEGTPPFTDSVSHRYKNDIAYAYALEIISGDKDASGNETGTFRPNDPINRAEVAKIVKLAIELL